MPKRKTTPKRKIWPYATELFAIQEVQRRQWGKYWIPRLTDDANRILELNARLGEAADVSDLLRQQERERKEDAPAERQALTAARLQQAFMLMQHQKAETFLDGWDLRPMVPVVPGSRSNLALIRKHPGRIDRAKLEAALAFLPEAEAPVDREPAAPSAETIADWIIARRQELIAAGENHGRDRLLSEAAKALGIQIKQVREVWVTHRLAKKKRRR